MAGWWDGDGTISGCVAAYQAIGAADLATSYVNLQNPGTYNAAPGTAPTFATATGWTFNGTTQYLTTGGVTPAAGWSAIVRFSAAGTPAYNAPLLGSGNNGAGNAFQIVPAAGGTGAVRLYGYGTSFTTASTNVASGVMAMAGTGNSYYNGVSDGATAGTFSGSGQALYIGCRNNGGTPDRYIPATIQAIAIYNTTLTDGEVATLTTAMNALAVASGQPAALRGIFVPGMTTGGRRIIGAGWGG